ncbi:MAG: helix-turn-helix transcriptional regulator [Deltaproteobacteria bacterium]|nr:helix-turn-helix transcriptional regulator [Deltaproteobacteria bacterium]
MKYGKYFSKQVKDPEFLKALAREGLIIDIQEEICRLMEENNISRVELAKRMGKTKGFITQILNSGRNLTLRTVADVFTALQAEVSIKARVKLIEVPKAKVYELPGAKIRLKRPEKYVYKEKYDTYEEPCGLANIA